MGIELRYGRWILVEAKREKPYLSIGRWILRLGEDRGSTRKVEDQV